MPISLPTLTYDQFLETIPDAAIVANRQAEIVFVNRQACAMFGYQPAELEGQPIQILVPETSRGIHAAEMEQFWARPATRTIGGRRQLSALRRGGSTFPADIMLKPIAMGGVNLVTCIVRDVTERAANLRRLSIQHDVTLALSEANSLAGAMPAILKAVCDGLGWQRGECWSAHWDVDKQATRLRCVETCQASPGDHAAFDAATREIEFAPGEGLPGRVWASGKAEWTPDIFQDGFARVALAAEAGLRAAFAFPVKTGGEVLGVMTFLDGRVRPPDDEQLRLMEAIGHQIGQFIERKRAEAALKESEERFRSLIEHGSDEVSILTADGKLIYESPSANPTLGYRPGEFLGRNLFELIHPDDRDRIQRQLAQLVANPLTQPRDQFRLLHRDGTWRWVEAVGTNLLDDAAVRGVVVNYHDITERKGAEEALWKLSRAVEQAADSIFVTDTEGVITYVNPAFAQLTGYAKEEAIGSTPRILKSGAQDDSFYRKLWQTILSGEVFRAELVNRKKNGEQYVAIQTITPIRGEHGRVSHFVATCKDITERKRAEDERNRFVQVLEASLNEIYMFDVESLRFNYVNHGARINLGYSMDELRSLTPLDLKPEFTPEAFREMIRPLKTRDMNDIVFETIHRRKNGALYPVEVHLQLVETQRDRAFVAIIHNITRRRQAETALRDAEARYRTLVENVPLTLYIDRADEDAGAVYVSPQIEDLVGYRPADYAADPLLWQKLIDPRDYSDAFRAVHEALESGSAVAEYRLIAKDGRTVWVRDSSVLIRDADGNPQFIQGFYEDISARKRAEEEARLLQIIARGIGEAEDLSAAIAFALRQICEITGWVMGEAWIPDPGGRRLECHPVWHSSVPGLDEFRQTSRGFAFAPGEGLPGVVWQMKKPLWIQDVGAASDFLRRQAGLQAGLKAALGIPVIARDQVILVLDFFLSETRAEDRRMVELISAVAAQFGLLMERKRAEEAMREAEHFSRSTLNALTSHIAVLDETGAIVAVNRAWVEFAAANGGDPQTTGVGVNYLHVCDIAAGPNSEFAADMAACIRAIIRAEQDVCALEYEYPCHSPREQRWFLARVTRFESGGPPRVVVSHETITARKLAEQALRQRLTELEAVSKISAALRVAQTLDEMLPIFLDETLAALDCADGAMLLHHPQTNDLRAAAERGWFRELRELPIRPGEGIVGTVFASGEPRLSREFVTDPLTRPASLARLPAGWGGICVPLSAATEVVGALFLSVQLPREFTPEETKVLVSLAQIAGAALHRLRLNAETERRLKELQALRAIDQAITSSFDSRVTLNILLEQVLGLLGVDAAGVLQFNSTALTLNYAAGRGFRGGAYAHSAVRLGEGLAGRAALEKRLAHTGEPQAPAPARADLLRLEGFVAHAAQPFVAKGHLKGVLEVFHRQPFNLTEDRRELLETLAAQAAIAIDNIQLFNGLQRSNIELGLAYDSTIEGWSRAMDLRDKETEGHTLRVTEMTLKLARAAGLREEELAHVKRGALLHDMGKLGVPDSILLKPGKLTDEEWAIMRQHPQFAYDMLLPIDYLRPALDIPYCHHEKWDGTGYPRGLKGEQIPLAARLFAVVDVWDALSSDRPYRPAWPREKIVEHIREQSGKHFDPKAVEAFLRMMAEA